MFNLHKYLIVLTKIFHMKNNYNLLKDSNRQIPEDLFRSPESVPVVNGFDFLKHKALQSIVFILLFFAASNSQAQDNPCMGASTIKASFSNRSIISGTDNQPGVKYKYANANVGTPQLDLIAELVSLDFGSGPFTATNYNFISDNKANGIATNFQPSFIPKNTNTTYTIPANFQTTLSSTWKFSFVLAGTNTPYKIPVIAQLIDNDGDGDLIRESVTAVTTPTSLTAANPTNQTLSGNNTFTGPITNQPLIGTDPAFSGFFYYNSLSSFTLRFSHNIKNDGTQNTGYGLSNRLSSLHIGCDYSPPNVVFDQLNISGKVFNDIDGINGTPANTVNGNGTNAGGQLYATLYNVTDGEAVRTVPIANDGTFAFAVPAFNSNGPSYSVYIGNVNTPEGQTAVPTTTLPSGWVNTSEYVGANAGSDGNTNGVLVLGVLNTTDKTDLKFGIEQIPTAGSGTNSGGINPQGTTQVTVPANTFTNTSVSTDPTLVTGIIITAFPTGATTIHDWRHFLRNPSSYSGRLS